MKNVINFFLILWFGLATTSYAAQKNNPEVAESKICGICHDTMDDTKESIRVLSCVHSYHHECVSTWYTSGSPKSNTCPLCRSPFEIKELKEKREASQAPERNQSALTHFAGAFVGHGAEDEETMDGLAESLAPLFDSITLGFTRTRENIAYATTTIASFILSKLPKRSSMPRQE